MREAPPGTTGSSGTPRTPGEVYIVIEFGSIEDAQEGRARLLASGVLDRFADKDLPKIVEEAEAFRY